MVNTKMAAIYYLLSVIVLSLMKVSAADDNVEIVLNVMRAIYRNSDSEKKDITEQAKYITEEVNSKDFDSARYTLWNIIEYARKINTDTLNLKRYLKAVRKLTEKDMIAIKEEIKYLCEIKI
uniref:Uncharacterized protein n=1 Tax=Strigamia maritima TaxID=126957 RepID=T1IYD3_STRMM